MAVLAVFALAVLAADEVGLEALAVLLGTAGSTTGTALVRANELVAREFAIRSSGVVTDILGRCVMAVETVTVGPAVGPGRKALAVQFHALGVAAVAGLLIYFLLLICHV